MRNYLLKKKSLDLLYNFFRWKFYLFINNSHVHVLRLLQLAGPFPAWIKSSFFLDMLIYILATKRLLTKIKDRSFMF